MRVPGLLSLCRLPLAVAFPFVREHPAAAMSLMVAAAATDVLDGWYARRFDQQTATGAVLDGAMDKLFAFTVLATLVVGGSLSVVQALLLTAREVVELPLLLRALVLRRPPVLEKRSASALGKVATLLQFVTVMVVISGRRSPPGLVLATGACGVLAATLYWRREVSAPR